MDPGTAAHRLRKMLLFQLVQETKRDNCHQCGKKIESIDDFSIEHIEPWLDSDNPKEKFFDLKNVSFSHIRCNVAAKRITNKIENPPGQKWCWMCKRFLPLANFPANASRHRECTNCNSKSRSEYRDRTNKR